MNLLKKDRRDFLPKEVKALVEAKEKYHKSRKMYIIILFAAIFITLSSIFAPKLITSAAPYSATLFASSNMYSNIKTPEFNVTDITSEEAQSILQHPVDANTQYAQLTVSSSVTQKSLKDADSRISKLYNYLMKRGSPMIGSVNTFIEVADQYGIDYRLLPAIATTESNLGKVIPKFHGVISYNPFGWGVTGNGSVINFNSWDEGIREVARSLAKSFGKENLKPEIMERTYTPPSYNGDHHWLKNTRQFMADIG